MKRFFSMLLVLGFLFPFTTFDITAIQLIFKDNKGHYHYRCTNKTGGKAIVVFRAEGVFVNGPTGQDFYPLNSAQIERSESRIKVVERYARIGCSERLRQDIGPSPSDQK